MIALKRRTLVRINRNLGLAIITAMLCLPQIAHADFLQGSALTTGISVTLTVGSSTINFVPRGDANAEGFILGGQTYNTPPTGNFSQVTAGPLQVSDPS